MKVQEIMSTNVETIQPHLSLRAAARSLSSHNVGALPVVKDGELLGVITDRDVSVYAIAIGRDPQNTEVQAVMTKTVFTCFEDQDIAEAAGIMQEHGIRRLTVLNRSDEISGFITVDDLARVSHELTGAVLVAAKPLH